MLKIACAFLVAAVGCSAIDDFGKFAIAKDGAATNGASDASDDLGRVGGRLGEACSQSQPCAFPNSCQPLPGGYCSRMCQVGAVAGCGLEGDCMVWSIPPATPLCLVRCDGKIPSCRAPDYACCDNSNVINSGLGHCAPIDSGLCKHL